MSGLEALLLGPLLTVAIPKTYEGTSKLLRKATGRETTVAQAAANDAATKLEHRQMQLAKDGTAQLTATLDLVSKNTETWARVHARDIEIQKAMLYVLAQQQHYQNEQRSDFIEEQRVLHRTHEFHRWDLIWGAVVIAYFSFFLGRYAANVNWLSSLLQAPHGREIIDIIPSTQPAPFEAVAGLMTLPPALLHVSYVRLQRIALGIWPHSILIVKKMFWPIRMLYNFLAFSLSHVIWAFLCGLAWVIGKLESGRDGVALRNGLVTMATVVASYIVLALVRWCRDVVRQWFLAAPKPTGSLKSQDTTSSKYECPVCPACFYSSFPYALHKHQSATGHWGPRAASVTSSQVARKSESKHITLGSQ